MRVRLINPTVDLEASHVSLVSEFRERGEPLIPWIIGEPYESFSEYVAMLLRASQGLGLPSGFVPHSTFWLVDGAGEVVAVSNLRHELNESLLAHGGHVGYGVRPSKRERGYATELLRLTLVEARRIGIQRALVTCDKFNPASTKVILKNRGELEDEQFVPELGKTVSRYWIQLT
jgi:predicted acetyltransferase